MRTDRMLTRLLIVVLVCCCAAIAKPSDASDGRRQLKYGSDGVPTSGRLTEVFRWRQIQYDQLQDDADMFMFPDEPDQQLFNERERGSAQRSNFTAYNNVPMGVTHHRGRLFITVPRRRLGIPATLNYVSAKASPLSSPTFRAYPSYQQNELPADGARGNGPRLVSVYRTRVDRCNRLWFVDTGLLEYPNNPQQIQRPSIWIVNLDNDQLLHRFEIPESIVQRGNGLASITVNVDPKRCGDAFAYIPDLANYRLYTYDLRRDRIWTFSHDFFKFDPAHGNLSIAGQQFQWDDGIFSIALAGPINERRAYFHPMVSVNEFAIDTRHLNDEVAASNGLLDSQFRDLGTRGPNTQSTMHDYDETLNVMFYAQIATYGLSCWNMNKPLHQQEQLQHNTETMIYPSDLNIDESGTLWMMTNSMPIFIYSQLDTNVHNFRVWRAKAADLIRGTICET